MLADKRLFPIYVLALLVAALVFVSCDEETAEDWVDPLVGAELCASEASVAFDSVADTSGIIDVTNCGNSAALVYTVTTESIWLSFSSQGGVTPGEFTIRCTENSSGGVRTGTVYLTPSDLDQTPVAITVTQSSLGPAFCVSETEWEAPALGGDSPDIDITNCGNSEALDWTATEEADWLTLSATSGTTPDVLVITADPNNTGADREPALVIVTAAGIDGSPDTIVVTQPPVMSLGSLGYTTSDVTYDITVVVDPDGGYPVAADGLGQLPLFIGDGIDPDATFDPVYAFDSENGYTARAIHAYRVSDDDYDVYVYVAQGADGVEIWGWNSFDLDGYVATGGSANDVYVRYGDSMYVAAGTAGLEIYDIADLGAITLAGSFDTDGDALGVHVSGNYVTGSYAFVADGSNGLVIIDIGEAGNPTLASTFTMTGDVCTGVAVVGEVAYVTEQATGLHIVDISDGTSPVELAVYASTDARGVRVYGDYAFVADGVNGVLAIDISDPADPTLAGSFDTDGEALSCYLYGDVLFVADGTGGITVLHLEL